MTSTTTARQPVATSNAPPVPPVGYAVVESLDFGHLAHALRGMNADLRQLSAGPFAGRVEVAELGPFRVMRITVNRVIQARGLADANGFVVSLITAANEGASWRGQRRKQGEVHLNLPSSEIDHLTGRSYDSVSINVDLEHFRRAALHLAGRDVMERLNGLGGWRASAGSFAALQTIAGRILTLSRARSAVLAPPARAAIEEAFTRRLLAALPAEPTGAAEPPASNRRRLAIRAEEFMLANLRRPLMMAELCEEFEASERNLRYAFQDHFGLSPLAYFKAQKLNAIRRQIKSTDAAKGQVQQIARQWGIVHLGNFAADYRELFGESPSQSAR